MQKKKKKRDKGYAQKVQARRRKAKKLGLPSNSPWPVIWAAEDNKKDKKESE